MHGTAYRKKRGGFLFFNNKACSYLFSFLFLPISYLAQPDMDIGMTGHNFSQQQAPPNQTAPWPESMMPIDQTFASQNRYTSNLMQ